MADNSNNEPDEEESGQETTAKELSLSARGTANFTARMTIGYSAKDIRERLENDEIALALVLTSTRLEQVLGGAIADRYDISEEQFWELYGDKGLGRYRHVTSILGLFDQYQGTLQDVAFYRGKLVHREPYGYLDQLEGEDTEREEVEETIEAAIEFIEEVER